MTPFVYCLHTNETPPIDVVSATIDSRTQHIRRRSFKNCSKLKSISIHENVTGIGKYAFKGCMSLSTITIPNSVSYIGTYAFKGCAALTTISIPKSVNFIGQYAFQECTSLTTATLSAKSLESVFYDCTSLTAVTLTESVTSIDGAFYGCTSLKTIQIPNSVTNIDCSFYGCSSLKTISIPDSVTSIQFAFAHCTSLTTIHIPNTVTSIEGAFKGCTSLNSMYIPDSVRLLRYKAFRGCTSLTNIALPKHCHTHNDNDVDGMFLGCEALDQRLTDRDDTIHQDNTLLWLKHRFDNLPIHQACYNPKLDVSTLSKLIQDNKHTVSSTDAMGMTALHILCCNANVTPKMIRMLKGAYPEAASVTSVTNMTPIMLFLACRGMKQEELEKGCPQSITSLMRLGLNGDELEDVLYILEAYYAGEHNKLIYDFAKQDKTSGLLPFMDAASSSKCSLDLVCMLAMRHPELLEAFPI